MKGLISALMMAVFLAVGVFAQDNMTMNKQDTMTSGTKHHTSMNRRHHHKKWRHHHRKHHHKNKM